MKIICRTDFNTRRFTNENQRARLDKANFRTCYISVNVDERLKKIRTRRKLLSMMRDKFFYTYSLFQDDTCERCSDKIVDYFNWYSVYLSFDKE